MGNRIYKKIVKGGGSPDKHTIYQRDAQGNTLAVYDNHVKSSEFIACKYDAKDIELVFEDIERAYDNCQPEMKPDCIEKEIERLRDKIADKDPCTKLIYEYIWSQNQPCYLDEQYRSLIEQFYNDHYGDYHSQADAAAKEDFLSSKANDIGDAHKMSKEQLDCFKEKLRRAMDMDQDKFNTYFNNLKNGIEYEQWKADIIDWLVNNGQSYTKHTDEVQAGKLYWQEQHLYGSKRLGMALPKRDITDNSIPPYESWLVGRQYELSNHLGNVLATIKDEKKQYSKTGSKVDYYKPFITSSKDYYPFGMTMPGRSYTASNGYRYSFNGKEDDTEIAGQQDYGMRIYDKRLGRFKSVDPLSRDYPFYTPYQFSGNSPIKFIDLDGLEPALPPLESINEGLKAIYNFPSNLYNGLTSQMSEMLKYKPTRNNNGNVVIDDNIQAFEHYYRGGGEAVSLGPKTIAAIKNSKDIQRYRNNIQTGKTPLPSKPTGKLPVNMENESANTFHLGEMTLDYQTKCNTNQCTTTYTVDDYGFVDPNYIDEYGNKALNKIGLSIPNATPDNSGTNLELKGGTTYEYNPVQWSETFENPGYETNDSGEPQPIQ